MARIWDEPSRYEIWVRIEVAVCRAERVAEIEARVHHDVNAFLDALAEEIGPASRYVHLGLTSSDVLDTCLALQLREAADLILSECDRLLDILERRAVEHRRTVMVGRTHGMHAEPMTFGLKLLLAWDEMRRNRERLAHARDGIATGKISGAVGTFAHLDPEVEEAVLGELGLTPAPISTQIVARDRHAELFGALAQTATSIERIAVEMRHLARSEIGEVQEFFGAQQKGSSAMPHKRNPWRFETLSGLARLMRGYAATAAENQILWHERDISNSSAERVIGPDATTVLHWMLGSLADLIEGLRVFPERMRQNLDGARGLIFSEGVLLALARHGLSRDEAYRLVQAHALATADQGGHLFDRLADDPEVTKVLTADELAACFDLDVHLRNVDAIFERVLGKGAAR
jgi:adenylosuccinate lyase